MAITTGDSVTLEYTGKLDEDETVFDTSRQSVAEEAGLAEAQPDREYDPLTVKIGDRQIIQGMEEGLVGLEAGTSATFSVPPEKGYGEWSDEHVEEFETDELREMLGGQLPEIGTYLKAEGGRQGEVIAVENETVRVDFNPRLAGETLNFEIEILTVN